MLNIWNIVLIVACSVYAALGIGWIVWRVYIWMMEPLPKMTDEERIELRKIKITIVIIAHCMLMLIAPQISTVWIEEGTRIALEAMLLVIGIPLYLYCFKKHGVLAVPILLFPLYVILDIVNAATKYALWIPHTH